MQHWPRPSVGYVYFLNWDVHLDHANVEKNEISVTSVTMPIFSFILTKELIFRNYKNNIYTS